jgi:hypothetical protein
MTARQDQAKIQVHIDWDGLRDMPDEVWDERTGGNMDSDSTKYRLGNMGPQLSLGGLKNIQNITCRRLFRDPDHARIDNYFDAVGRAPCTVHEWLLDGGGSPYGSPIVWTGTLKRVNPPDRNSNSQEAAIIEIEIDTQGSIGR